MPNKSFSIFQQAEGIAADTAKRLVLEVGKTHVTVISQNVNKNIAAFELFSYAENEAADFSALFAAISADSKLINAAYENAEVFINNEVSILVPIFKFDREIAEDYLTIMFGENVSCKTQFEHLPVEPGIINVYRIEEQVSEVLRNNLKNVTFKHTWSNIAKKIISGISAYPAECIYIQFYNTFIIAAVIKDKKLQIIQSFIYQAPEDVLYTLLNLTTQFKLNSDKLVLKIGGMIDLNFTLYRELITYFKHVEVQNADAALLPEIKDYPLHYFTPFFNLAL